MNKKEEEAKFNNSITSPFLALISITILAVLFAYICFLLGQQGLFWDANSYYRLGEKLAQEGLFNFHNETRTFGYPAFIAVIWLLSDRLPSTVQFLVFNIQLLIFLGTCFFAFHVFSRIFKKNKLALILFAALALNPFMLIYTGVVLSDVLSAITILLAFLFAIPISSHTENPFSNNTVLKISNCIQFDSFLSFFFASYATMIRPANLTITFAILAIWCLRLWLFQKTSIRMLLAMILGFVIPFIPQLINNYYAYSQIQPLIVRNLYYEQLSWGMQYLKYVSVVLPGDARGVMYENPFVPLTVSTPLEFFYHQPFEFVLTQGVHLFALFDYDYAYPYITDLNAWYRFPLAVANFTFLFGAMAGVIVWIPRIRHLRSFDRLDLALAGMLIGVLVYLPGYILAAVEPRFSLPVYLLLSPFFVYTIRQIEIQWTDKHWRQITFQALGLIVFLILTLSLSHWLQSQAPLLEKLVHSSNALDGYRIYDVQAKFGDRIELINYGIGEIGQIQGGQSLYLAFRFVCNGASTESYDVQINLVDFKGRIWSQAVHDTHNKISPCINSLWKTSNMVTDVVALRLSPTMPAGNYSIQMAIYDPLHANYLNVQSGGKQVGEWLRVLEIPLAKNQSSFLANQLYIENPFFVDMGEMRLLGYTSIPEKVQMENELEVGLYWRAREIPRSDYLVVVQLRSSDGTAVAENANRPAEGSYSTLLWKAGEVLLDWHTLSLPRSLISTDYDVIISLQDAITHQVIGKTRIANITVLP